MQETYAYARRAIDRGTVKFIFLQRKNIEENHLIEEKEKKCHRQKTHVSKGLVELVG